LSSADTCPNGCETAYYPNPHWYHDKNCPEAGRLRDSWTTPEWLTELLPAVDLDPASNYRSTVKAVRSCWLERGEDGLAMRWWGSIFLNGPYSDMLPWANKANDEWQAGRLTEAIFLVKLDPTTRWWRALTVSPYIRRMHLWLLDDRLQHSPPPRIKASTNNFASAIIHWRLGCSEGEGDEAPVLPLWDAATLYTESA
jgi:hypothetical protein